MQPQSHPPAPATPPPAAAPVTPVSKPPRTGWTPAKQRVFLAALLEHVSVSAAARAAGMSRSSANRLRRRLAGTPFDTTWERVIAEHARRLTDPFAPAPQ